MVLILSKASPKRAERHVSSVETASPLPGLRALFGLLAAVTTEGAGHGELAQLVPHHVLADIDRDEFRPVVHRDRVADHLRRDRRAARPGLDHPALAPIVHRRYLVGEVIVDEVALLQ